MLRRLLAFGMLVSLCIGMSSAWAVASSPKKYAPVEPSVASSVKSSKAPASYSPALTAFTSSANLSGEGTLGACQAWENTKETNDPVPCVEGDTSSSKVIVLVGDSNAGNWSPGLSIGLAKAGYKLDVFTFAGCPTSDMKYVASDYIGTPPASCNTWHKTVITSIKKLSPIAVLTASSGIGPQYNPQAWNKGYNTLFSDASGGKTSVRRIVIGTSPYFPTAPPTCLSLHPSTPLQCLLSTNATTIVGPYSSYKSRDAAVASAAHATLISTSSLFCSNGECPSEVAGTVTFVDNDHVTTDYADEISAPLTAAVLAALK